MKQLTHLSFGTSSSSGLLLGLSTEDVFHQLTLWVRTPSRTFSVRLDVVRQTRLVWDAIVVVLLSMSMASR
jgi:hypothetical protein